jgi:hypothetical protein
VFTQELKILNLRLAVSFDIFKMMRIQSNHYDTKSFTLFS